MSTKSFSFHIQLSPAEGPPKAHLAPSTLRPPEPGALSSGTRVQKDAFLSSRCSSRTFWGLIAISGITGLCFVLNGVEDSWTGLASLL